MANLASSAVTVLASWSEGGVAGKRRIAKRVSVALTGQGGPTNKIPASAFGFRVIEEVSNIWADNILGQLVLPTSTDGSYVYIATISNPDSYVFPIAGDWSIPEAVFVVKGY